MSSDAISRRIIGPAIPYSPENVPDQSQISSSLRATRSLAWKIFAQVIGNVSRDVPRPDGETTKAALPRVFSWYGTEDVGRLMAIAFRALPEGDLIAGLPLSGATWKNSEDLFNNELDALPLPLQKKWARFFEGGVDSERIIGSTGLNRMIFSPQLIESLTRRYADLQDCFPAGDLPAPLAPAKACWSEPLPRSSVLVKTAWINAQSGFSRFATDAESLKALMSRERANWADVAIPGPVPETIVKAENAGKTFVLGGIHIVSKDLDDWLWISAWWSYEPDRDFGEDRPEAVKALGAPWNQYKICAVSSYTQDLRELVAIAETHPELAAAYRSVLGESGFSWCSNPYIERGDQNPRTNCIGCHQFAGTDAVESQILNNSELFPAFGRGKQRETFPTDYIWTATRGSQPWLDTLNSLLYMRSPRADVKP